MTVVADDTVRIGKLRFPHHAKLVGFRCTGLHLRPGDPCIVQTKDGSTQYAEVRTRPGPLKLGAACVGCLPQVIRKATEEDREQQATARRRESHARDFFRKKVAERDLPMQVLYVEKPFGRNRLIFHFEAEQRVDFRELVKDLAHVYDMRIEMRQEGVRDQAAAAGGMGPCGKTLCCATHLDGFKPIAIKMAKQQGIPLSPNSITGMCGRLKCCLRYEYDASKGGKRRTAAADAQPGTFDV